MSAASDFVAAFRLVLETRERQRALVRQQRVVGRGSDGTVQTQRLDAECVTKNGTANFYDGQTVVTAGAGASIARQGTAAVAAISETADRFSGLWVENLIPSAFQAGDVLEVTVTGGGFEPGTRFQFLRPGLERLPNEDIVIDGSTFVSESEYLLDIEVSADAAPYPDGAPLAFDRPARGAP
jgi:hypothetical protein